MNNTPFSSLPISQEVLQAVTDMGFTQPSPIQAAAIPSLSKGIDIIGQAMTGTGKIAAFAIPLIDKIDATLKKTQALILCPTRELCVQVSQEIEKLARYKQKLNTLAIYGGQSIVTQMSELKRGAHIVVGTPGRTLDHLRRSTLKLDSVTTVVLDEADEMFDMGFRDDIQTILTQTPSQRQTVLFSAAMSSEIRELAKRFQKNPITVQVSQENQAQHAISQYYYHVAERSKADLLVRILDLNEHASGIICNTKHDVDVLFDKLNTHGYSIEALHGDMNQVRRNRVMSKFKEGKVTVLVATDVAARGIDIPGMEMVINYDLPKDDESYVHRIGRTGRAGLSGRAISFMTGADMYRLKRLSLNTNSQITQLEIPSLESTEVLKAQKVIASLQKILAGEDNNIEHYKKLLTAANTANINPLNLAAALLRMKLKGLNKEIHIDEIRSPQARRARGRRLGGESSRYRRPNSGGFDRDQKKPRFEGKKRSFRSF